MSITVRVPCCPRCGAPGETSPFDDRVNCSNGGCMNAADLPHVGPGAVHGPAQEQKGGGAA